MSARAVICEMCGYEVEREVCMSCELYNAAVVAQRAAAAELARARFPLMPRGDAWLNEHGVWAYIDGVATQVGTAEESAPFAALTTEARKVTTFWRTACRKAEVG